MDRACAKPCQNILAHKACPCSYTTLHREGTVIIEVFAGHATHSKWVALAVQMQLRRCCIPCLVTQLPIDWQVTPAQDGGAPTVPNIMCDVRDWCEQHTEELMHKFPKCKVSSWGLVLAVA